MAAIPEIAKLSATLTDDERGLLVIMRAAFTLAMVHIGDTDDLGDAARVLNVNLRSLFPELAELFENDREGGDD